MSLLNLLDSLNLEYIFKKKSESNLKAADILKSRQLQCYPSVIHCSYYSVVQAILHILVDLQNRTPESLDHECKVNKAGIHEVISKNIRKEYSEVINEEKANAFFNAIGVLKGARVEADYDPVDVDPNSANIAYGMALSLVQELKDVFKY